MKIFPSISSLIFEWFHRAAGLRFLSVVALVLYSVNSTSLAGSATWRLDPVSDDWNTAANWMPATVPNGPFPNGPFPTATFGPSNLTHISVLDETNVDGIIFNPDANAFTIKAGPGFVIFRLLGAGIINNDTAGKSQRFVAASPDGLIGFGNSAVAGSSRTVYTVEGEASNGRGTPGAILFTESSSADHAFFNILENSASGDSGGAILFYGNSTAAHAYFTVGGGTASGARGGRIEFFNNSDAGAGSVDGLVHTPGGLFHINGGATTGAGGGAVTFRDSSGAAASLLQAGPGLNGGEAGLIEFTDHSRGGSSRIEVFGDGTLDISGQKDRTVTIGLLEGNGNVFLGACNLSVGNDLFEPTNFSFVRFFGLIQDGGVAGGTGGTLTKIGQGKLILGRSNTYTGGTFIKEGKLVVDNPDGSGTGTGPVLVEGGKLGGKGTIAGAVTIGTGSSARAALAPGFLLGGRDTLTIQSSLTFKPDGLYEIEVNSSDGTADEVVANGVTINPGAQALFTDRRNGTLAAGTVFTVISNTAATPIAGTFRNLADGSTFTNNGNTYWVNYEGGDGNDLTLTVVQ